jgi:hypothetical protein
MTRGLVANTAGTLLFSVVGNTVYSVNRNGISTTIGTLLTRRGHVGMKIGLTQLVIVDGPYGYVYDLESKVFGRITSESWLGSYTVEELGGYFSFIDPNTQTFYTSALEDALTLDALDFATANSSPDKLVGQVVTTNALVLLGETSGEVWQLNTSNDPNAFVFDRNPGVFLEVGLLAPHTAKQLDNSAFWLGRDQRGAGIVYKMEGFRAVRISTNAIEELIQKAIRDGNDVSQACAYAYQQDGHSFYVLTVPGLKTTWAYDVATGEWAERSDYVSGEEEQHPGKYHAYAYGQHLVAGDDDLIYAYDPTLNTIAGRPMLRERTSPHYATPQLSRVTFSLFELDCVVGAGIPGNEPATVQLQYSNDGGNEWSNWRTATLGSEGEYSARARFLRCGSGRDRVWRVRCTDNTDFAIIAANVEVA